MLKSACAVGLLLAASVNADVYMNHPRGSNNRLNERSANRNNANRMFDSQNNNRGGYNVGDKTYYKFNETEPFFPPSRVYDAADKDEHMQYQFHYMEGSKLVVEWTAQHGCGGNEGDDAHKLNCNMVIQYTCDTEDQEDPAMMVRLKDGGNTGTPGATTDAAAINATATANDAAFRGRHESESWYYECSKRSRNRGLFLADQNVKGSDARYTRQNPNANRRGLECAEERDYYPYWSPSPWRDVAYLTDTMDHCGIVANGTQNTNMVYKCVGSYEEVESLPGKLFPITEEACSEAGGVWTGYTHNVPAPDCQQAAWSRVNHLGNGRDGMPITYNWTVPTFEELGDVKLYDDKFAKCVLRLRYNISTDDYDPWTTDAKFNHNKRNEVISPVQQNPTVDVDADLQGLRLAINTAQFGRTFQDRSHVFYVSKRPAMFADKTIYNLNVRGKRGNIVQTFPAVEYDFVPNRLHIEEGDLLHVQWTGSNTHNNGNPAGDGQAGDAGEGAGGTDRSNMVQIESSSDNYPIPLDMYEDNMWAKSTCYDMNGQMVDMIDCALTMATSGQFLTVDDITTDPEEYSTVLNKAPASLVGGIVMEVEAGTYHYMSSRNNNFSNRSQKGTLIVETPQ